MINYAPYIAHQVSTQRVHLGTLFEFVITPDIFRDPDQDPLFYSVYFWFYNQTTNVTEMLPVGEVGEHWLHYNPRVKKLFGQPLEQDFGINKAQIVVTDRVDSITLTLNINVYNNPPRPVRFIESKFITFNEESVINLGQGSYFSDSDGDALTYSFEVYRDQYLLEAP